ncbi:zinc finger protein 572-like isoform X2 [Melanotaenia boesemani]|uniref:zinc finger protein 572-like isoform X2 n=1 Tax=Melanotaenia boesemani TaxID=1250792 RepID=UPI001C0485F5|nr:zinc finger protein 572-like isoform X2 [Melanotaenia boesemani]
MNLGVPLPLSALRLFVPPLQLVSAACWQTVQHKVVADYGMLEEFVSMVTDIVPELLSSCQRAQLTLGLRARLILELCQLDAPELELVQPHLDRMRALTEAWLSEAAAANVGALDSDFVDLVKNLVRSPDERRHFFQRVFHEDFGPTFEEALHTLMWLFLSRLEKFFPVPTFQQVASMFGEPSGVLVDCLQTVSQSDELQTLLQYHKDLNQLEHCGSVLDGACILSALRLPSIETTKTQTQHDVLDDVLSFTSDVEDSFTVLHTEQINCEEHLSGELMTDQTNGTQLLLENTKRHEEKVEILQSLQENASCPLKECQVQLKRLDTAAASRSRSVRPNRGLRMKVFLLEEKRELCYGNLISNKSASRKTKPSRRTPVLSDKEEIGKESSYLAPVSSCSDADSWSFYSEDSCQTSGSSPSMADSWSYYSDDGSSFVTPVSSSGESDSFSGFSKMDATGASAPLQNPGLSKASALKKTRELQCLICKEHVDTNLRAHMKTHFPDGVYACPRCDARYKLLASFLQHVKKTCFQYSQQAVDPEKPNNTKNMYKCDKCQEAFRYKISLQRHTLTHHELYCSVCQKVLRDAATLERHKTSHTPFQCTRCDESFIVFKHLLRHCENIHKITEPFRCNHCPKTSPKLRFLIKHEWQHMGRLPFQCALCSLKFKSDPDLAVHQRVHTREKPHLCTECGKTFSQGSNLCRHLRLVHSESRDVKRHLCTQCEKSFKEKGALRKHQRSKHLQELFRYPCPSCGKMVSAATMARHKLMHTGEKPFKCSASDCDKFFRSTSEVKRHVLVHHSTQRPFKCDTCGKGFIGKSYLDAHVKIHSGEKPFACSICGKRFPKAYSMLRHKTLLHAFLKH